MARQYRKLCTSVILLMLASCSTSTHLPETATQGRHLEAPEEQPVAADIPEIVSTLPLISNPTETPDPELYTFTVIDKPVKDVLIAVGRDANINIDVNPQITGQVNINAINRSLPQILNRISEQTNIRWFFDESGNLIVEPDLPFWKIYTMDYVNINRGSVANIEVSTQLSNVGDSQSNGGNSSSSSIALSSNNNFWTSLRGNLLGILEERDDTEITSVVMNQEAGLINIHATSKQQKNIEAFLNRVQSRSTQQVLIEATVVEVALSDSYKAGVDWDAIQRNSGNVINFAQNLSGTSTQGTFLTIDVLDGQAFDITSSINLLSQFGDSKVLSSPKLMMLNNQPAILQVVDNLVYFDIEATGGVIADGVATSTTLTTTPNSVSVGFVMPVIAQISENGQVTMNLRPAISRVIDYVSDPNPQLAANNIENLIPQIQVSQFDSVLKVYSGQVAVLGGLMQDTISKRTDGVPGLSRLPGIGNLFSQRNDRAIKTELIVFIRPTVIKQPSLDGDLSDYRTYLQQSKLQTTP